MKVKFKVFRYDKNLGSKPRYQKYEVEVKKGMTVSECLVGIKSKLDGTLSFRAGCRNGVCGICALKINGVAKLGCKTQVYDELKEHRDIIVEPLDNLPLIKDLVVDMEPFWENHKKIKPWLKEKDNPEKENIVSKDEMKLLEDVTDCIMCGACHSVCNTLDVEKRFIGPAALVKAKRFLEDVRDSREYERLKNYNSKHFIWDCTDCELCDEVCPMGIKPLECIRHLRKRIISRDLGSRGATHHKSFLSSIEKSGLLDEAKYPIHAIGFNPLRLGEIIPVGLRMIKKGKAPDFIHKPIEKMDEVKKLFKEVKE